MSEPENDETESAAATPRFRIVIEPRSDGQLYITVETLDGSDPRQPAPTIAYRGTERAAGFAGESAPHLRPITIRYPAPAQPAPRLSGWATQVSSWARQGRTALQERGLAGSRLLFGLALAIYLLVRVIGLENFPIYFFTDEAVQTVLAADLVRDNFFSYEKELFPTYFKNGPQYNLSVSVYVQLLPYLLFGKSVLVTRLTAVLLTLIAPLALGLMLRDIFQIRYWWAAPLLLSMAPAWFLHSRTAFETALATAFYAAFLYFYLLYRYRSARYLYHALVAAALVFYSYSPAQVVIAGTGLLLLVSDARYHWSQRAVILRGLGLGAILVLPYVRFQLAHPGAAQEHLRLLGSYWLEPLPLADKWRRYLGEYLYGLSPGYWFIPNDRDLIRHLMKGYGHLLRATLPLALIGLGVALRSVRSSAHRTLLIAFLVVPSGAALVQIGITRVLIFVIPATAFIALGLDRAMSWLERVRLPPQVLTAGLFAVLAGANLFMLRDGLVNGPVWYSEYGLGGLQFGARQVFTAAREHLASQPDDEIVISPDWANGTDVVARFFFPDPLPIQLAGVEDFLSGSRVLDEKTLLVLPASEYDQILDSKIFKRIDIERTIPYPDGRPGFYFLRLLYVDNLAEVLETERMERLALLTDKLQLNGEQVEVRYSQLDMGQIGDVFDGDDETVARTLASNPFVIELNFPSQRPITGFSMVTGSAPVEIRALLYSDREAEPVVQVFDYHGSIEAPMGTFELDQPVRARTVRFEVRDVTQGPEEHVHVWELRLR